MAIFMFSGKNVDKNIFSVTFNFKYFEAVP